MALVGLINPRDARLQEGLLAAGQYQMGGKSRQLAKQVTAKFTDQDIKTRLAFQRLQTAEIGQKADLNERKKRRKFQGKMFDQWLHDARDKMNTDVLLGSATALSSGIIGYQNAQALREQSALEQQVLKAQLKYYQDYKPYAEQSTGLGAPMAAPVYTLPSNPQLRRRIK